MAIKTKFTKDEWQLLTDGPEWIFAALAAADGNVAITTKTKESKAFKKVVKNYSTSSPLVKEVQVDKTKASKEIKRATLSDAEQALEEINKILDTKLSRPEANQYRSFLKEVADSVAEAAGEGAFGAGKKISKKEGKALTKIKDALKATKAAKVEAKPTAKPRPKAVGKPKAKPSAKPTPRPAAKPAGKPKPVGKKPKAAARPRPTASSPSIPSQAPTKKEEYLAVHTVASDETLSHIALKYYNSAVKEKYMHIYEANKDVIGDNPNRVKPGTVLNIPKPPATPKEPVKKPEYLAVHTVASDETLSHIALKYYNSAVKAKYMVIYEANKDVIGDNPNRVKPGTVLNIPKLED